MRSVAVRVFSGLHLGAELEMNEGTYVIGTDESCDIILSDSVLAGRHAAFHVRLNGTEPSVEIEPLDGSVFSGGQALKERTQLPQAKPFRLASVIMAWAPSSSDADIWNSVEEFLAAENAANGPSVPVQNGADVQEQASDAHGEEETSGSGPAPETDAAAPENPAGAGGTDSSSPAAAEELALDPPEEKRGGCLQRVLKWLFLAVAIGLVAALCFSLKDKGPSEDRVQTVRKLLDEAGYKKLSVTDAINSVSVSGRIASDSERGRILKLAQFLPFPVYLNLTVRSDAADAVQASYNAMGLYPEVSELPPANRMSLFVRGYIRDGVLEEKALAAARHNLPAVWTEGREKQQKIEIYSEIRHQEDVALLLGPALAASGLHNAVQVKYMPGRVLISGALTTGMRNTLSSIASDIQQKLGVPVPIDIVNASFARSMPSPAAPAKPREQAAAPAKKPRKETADKKDGKNGQAEKTDKTAEAKQPDKAEKTDKSGKAVPPPKPDVIVTVQPEKPELPPMQFDAPPVVLSFKVTSVSMGALKFLSLANGERIFEGGELPGGYIVEEIGVNELTLSKNGQQIIYPLRGGHE